MRILVRLPNWLGDLVMSVGFINVLNKKFPDAKIDVICKKGMEDLLDFFPTISKRFIFSKQEFDGIFGAYKFGRKIKRTEQYDLFFCLPNSFSSALMGFSSGAKKRIGFKNEGRNFLFTQSFSQPKNLHRAEEYIFLLEKFLEEQLEKPNIFFNVKKEIIKNQIIVNFNSEAASRRMPMLKAISILERISNEFSNDILLIGAPKDKDYVDELCRLLNNNRVKNLAGKTSLKDLAILMANSKGMLSVDSGPSHLCNALQTKVVVLHGADDENNTEAYNKDFVDGMRNGKLPCEPCVKNVCKPYGSPKCLEMLDENLIIEKISRIM